MSDQPTKLRINREEKRFLGVCAGIADYLDMPVLLVRLIFIICVLTWPTLILAYFFLFICLDKNITKDKVYEFFSENNASQHFKKLNYRRPIYRNRRNKHIAGVCSGIADYLEVRPITVRAAAVLSVFILGPYALLAYAIGWIMMEPNPAPRFNGHHKRKRPHKSRYAERRNRKQSGISSSRINASDYDSTSPRYNSEKETPGEIPVSANSDDNRTDQYQNNSVSLEECADIYYTLETRMREIEAFMTSKKFRLHCEINRI
ncbi:MAG: PspC domain-containing protein [Gammaproteobacteria bacterium]|nr:PspC domain-containing protein [Gammaproteobacteria bacterium]